jgi:hypothetical protein
MLKYTRNTPQQLLEINTKENQLKQTLKLVTLGMLMCGLFVFAKSPLAHAATLTVNSNLDTAVQDDGDCTLREALNNVNAGADTTDGGAGGDCAAADGNNDTVLLPEDTILLTANLPLIGKSIAIEGRGMGETVIDGAGQWEIISIQHASSSDTAVVKNLKLTAFKGISVGVTGRGSVRLSRLDIDGSGASNGTNVGGGIIVSAPNTDISEVHVHNLMGNGVANGLFGINIHVINGMVSNTSIANVTIDNMSSDDSSITAFSINSGLLDGSLTPGNSNVLMKNVTIANLNAGTNIATGVVAAGAVSGGNSVIHVEMNNTTISGLSGAVSGGLLGQASAVLLGGAALGNGDSNTMSFTGTNNLFSDGIRSCGIIPDLAPVLGAGASAGTLAATITSQGGNLADDTSCSPYFTQPTDQNNLTTLGATLEALSDNGGFVPTIALKQGSPAIDSGITLAGLTSDARGALRPQGAAFDSGAYESPYTKATQTDSLASTGGSTLVILIVSLGLVGAGGGYLLHKQLSSK